MERHKSRMSAIALNFKLISATGWTSLCSFTFASIQIGHPVYTNCDFSMPVVGGKNSIQYQMVIVVGVCLKNSGKGINW